MNEPANNNDPVAAAIARRLRELDGYGRTGLIDPYADQNPAVFYVPGVLLTDQPRAVVALLERLFPGCEVRVEEGETLAQIHLSDKITVCAPQLAHDLNRRLGDEGFVSLNHILTLAPTPRIGPGDDPTPTDEPDPMCEELDIDWQVAVVDTGLFGETGSGLTLTAMTEPEISDADGDKVVDFAGSGHGGFIGGILKRMIPNLEVHVRDVVTRDLARHTFIIEEADIIEDVDKVLGNDRVAVINLSLGTYADEGDVPALREAMRRWIKRRPDVLFAAAAGNDSTKERFYPAAFAAEGEFRHFVMSVGAFNTSPREADTTSGWAEFSNRGRWVRAVAPGVHHRSDYMADVEFVYGEDQGAGNPSRARFDGLAEWSGTSFATPYAVAEVVRYAATCGFANPREAWEHLRRQTRRVVFPLSMPCPGKQPGC